MFPIQVAILLSRPGVDFTGGEFVVVESRPRMQSRAEVIALGQGEAVAFAVRERPMAGKRGDYRVFSTPSMTYFVEMTAHKLVEPHLKAGQGQVGLQVNIRHMAPTPIGKKVRCEAELVAIDRRKLTFKCKVFDEVEQVGEADHDRFVIDLDKYMAKLKAKVEGSAA